MSLGFYLNMEQCSGCGACVAACKDRYGLEVPGVNIRRATQFETGTFPNVGAYSISISCNHCESPACVANCPTGAMYKDEESGIVLHDDNTCIGCKTCVASCPYGAPQHFETENLILKCDSCKALRDAGQLPVCVAACPSRALDFGDIDDLRSKYGEGLVSDAAPLPESSSTQPNLLLRARECASETNYREVIF